MTARTSRRIERLETAAPKADDDRPLDYSVLSDEERERFETYCRRLHEDKESRGLAELDYGETSPLSDEEIGEYVEILRRLIEAIKGTA